MRRCLSTSIVPFLLLAFTCSIRANTNPEALARRAISSDPAESASAISDLRRLGPDGLTILIRVYGVEIERQITNPATNDRWLRLSAALDQVSQQKDSYSSGLYWYTDLAEAKVASRSSGKPILSLRLLGKLTDEFSCANSRFFRTVLYANAEVSKLLREQFVMHWQSVRPVPRVTIDFGDGRKLERTLTGNSIHYILDADGRVLDALPGLYGPDVFLRSINSVLQLYARLGAMDPNSRARTLDEYHRAAVRSAVTNWIQDIQKTGGKIPEPLLPAKRANGALAIGPLAVTKSGVEVGILRAMTRDADALGGITDAVTWSKIAAQHSADAKLDEHSIALIRRQMQSVFERQDGSGLTAENKLTNLTQKLQLSIALDTVRNEYALHSKIHAWLVADPTRLNLDALNDKVYAELFLTPKSDLWLGLFSADEYTALTNGGISP